MTVGIRIASAALDEGLRRRHVEAKRNPRAVKPITVTDAEKLHTRLVGHIELNDWKNPNYDLIEAHRYAALTRIRETPNALPALKLFYKLNPATFIDDWGYTYDPRNIEIDRPSKVPFKLFEKQWEWLDWVMDHWQSRRRGMTEKSRDCGISWLSVGLASTLCLFYQGMNIGFGSRKQEYVDRKGDPKALFFKARKFMEYLPKEFNGGWDERRDAPLMRLSFRKTESTMTGEIGDNIGRGDRAGIYFVDEHAYLEHADLVDRSLSNTTNCQMDISSVNGMANAFAVKRHAGKTDVFIFDWRDDPRKDDAWYQKQVDEQDEVTVAQEVDRNYQASVDGILIPSKWVRAAVDAHIKLGIEITGAKRAGLDVADEGKDLNAFAGGQGILVNRLEEWKGTGGDIYSTVERCFDLCDEELIPEFKYDADGLGAGVRGDARKINEKRRKKNRGINVLAFRGSEGTYRPDAEDVKGRKNKDYFANRKAQGWWGLRTRFRNTYRAVHDKQPFNVDEIISISSECPLYLKLVTELSQPTYSTNKAGKIVINKMPDGARSPNLGDAVMIKFAAVALPLNITPEAVSARGTGMGTAAVSAITGPNYAGAVARAPGGMTGGRFRGSRIRT